MQLIPYILFEGKAEEALDFYISIFGGEKGLIQRYSEAPPMPDWQIGPDQGKYLIHGRWIHSDFTVYVSDSLVADSIQQGNAFSLSMEMNSKEQLDTAFELLKQGAQVKFEPQEMFWGAYYCKLIDKYGIGWDLNFQLTSQPS